MNDNFSPEINQTETKIKERSEVAVASIKNTADKTGQIITTAGGNLKKATISLTEVLIKLTVICAKTMLFTVLWLPCRLLTATAVICTVVVTVIYYSTGIGFSGICIAGLGCCIMGAGATVWLLAVLSGGKTENA